MGRFPAAPRPAPPPPPREPRPREQPGPSVCPCGWRGGSGRPGQTPGRGHRGGGSFGFISWLRVRDRGCGPGQRPFAPAPDAEPKSVVGCSPGGTKHCLKWEPRAPQASVLILLTFYIFKAKKKSDCPFEPSSAPCFPGPGCLLSRPGLSFQRGAPAGRPAPALQRCLCWSRVKRGQTEWSGLRAPRGSGTAPLATLQPMALARGQLRAWARADTLQ